MGGLVISADFPLGVYTGHGPDGGAERFPDVARLFSALVQAAAAGTLSTGDPEAPFTAESLAALDWLEEHPPDALVLPGHTPVAPGVRRFAYRKEGVFLKEVGKTNYKVTGRPVSDGTALGGPVQWVWDDGPSGTDTQVCSTLEQLCADVPHLGEASSPVRLTVHEGEGLPAPTHRRDRNASLRAVPGAVRQAMPNPGRRAELDRAHAATTLGRKPSASGDKHTTSAVPHAALPPRDHLRSGIFASVEQHEPDVPWTQVLAVPVIGANSTVPEERYVSVCVALHRALVSRLGPDAPPEITGRYAPSDAPPANRVALHLVPGDLPALPFSDGRDRFLVLVPRGMPGPALGMLASALAGVRRVVTSEHQLTVAPEEIEVYDGAQFWKAPPEGAVRTWDAQPAVVVERRLKSKPPIRDVDLAAAWSLGNVLRDLEPAFTTKDPVARHAAVVESGAQLRGRAFRTLTPTAYVHRTDRRSPIEPFRLTLTLSTAVPDRAILALGQSRHLGCGLLVPTDIPGSTQERS